MHLGKVPIREGGARQETSNEQSTQVSMATLMAATTKAQSHW